MKNLICWYNNKYIKLSEVPLSVLDFGFIHSDATYDVFKAIQGKLKHYEKHYNRFVESCHYFHFKPIENSDQIALKLMEINQLLDVFIWLCVWRGHPKSGNPRDLSAEQKSLIYIKPYYPLSKKAYLSLHIETEHIRTPDRCVDQRYKNFNWMEFTLAQRKINHQQFDSVLLLSQEGYITEGPGFGICFIKQGTIITPLNNCLGSITIDIVEDIASSLSLAFKRRNIKKEDLLFCEEAFACSTSGGITLVSNIDDKFFESHLIAKRIKELYERY